ncbi:alpha-amylase family protein [Lentimicrobium sp.]|uniref:alpha-amylase family protein n=1 Tax=Lentimicrobium sp. TaxID=2034841 RepID=UPI0025D0C292|nr:alpha-amylase family protein [Lentimicrobium sp.]MCO5256262.1 alpha-amylase family protein [Lentimicrobium sp.]MCO5262965.1 alpha-amylase family protein [Lentimicrobium sp.]HPF65537.1 alpha-amylase family protein [Lentimicrobium sp.]HPR26683.1 alpha-amylase family protein [Lentimicrobium sp.]
MDQPEKKIVVYQVFTRLFGNTNTSNIPWGTIEDNGVGKFNDFTDQALEEIRALGVTHIWYTGVPHHAVIRDYTAYGISDDDPDVVKGRAGSPYAVKDYYNVNPDLAVDPAKRLDEFRALLERTHRHGLKAIIDIVPNHVARHYKSLSNPPGTEDFGASDDVTVEYARNNNFYYIPGQPFRVPQFPDWYKPLGGEPHPMADGKFEEFPAKWTGNGSRLVQPDFNDWYETVKINYGIRPDGTKDFDTLPAGFEQMSVSDHYQFWQGKDVPDSWKKFRDIALYWVSFGVDGFRFDMAEMVPVEFWSYMNSAIKDANPDAFLLAEVYNPSLYRDYLHLGKMDYLYDKVELYDTLKNIIQGHGSADHIAGIQAGLADIEHHMLHFLENHDEQRLPSPAFAGNALKGKPAMTLSATISTAPTMIYFGQEVGEPGEGNAGFGSETRTTIFDYWGVPAHQRWMNNGKFDGGLLTAEESALRDFYKRLLNFTINSSALMGEYQELHSYNRANSPGYYEKGYTFARWSEDEHLLILVNFKDWVADEYELKIPSDLITEWQLADGKYQLTDQLYQEKKYELIVTGGLGKVKVAVEPLESLILKLEK